MNYYNPYFYTMNTPKVGLLGRLFGSTGVSISNFLNGTQRVLNIANQTIPLVKQVKPMIGNAKTMFRVMNEFKKTDRQSVISQKNIIDIENTNTEANINNDLNIIEEQDNNGPTFFM